MRKTFLLDTSVFLHDPTAIPRFGDNDVVIPFCVLEELDQLKKTLGEKGFSARTVLRYIDSLKLHGDLKKGVQIPEGPFLKIVLDVDPELKNFSFPMDRPSHKTLFVAYTLSQKSSQPVIFVTKDFVIRIKAEVLGLLAEDYEGLKASFAAIPKGVRKICVEKKVIDYFYKDGFIEYPIDGIAPNEYCLFFSKERSEALTYYHVGQKKFKPLINIEKGIFGVLPLNLEQKCVIDLLLRDEIQLVCLLGPAGTGKTLLALAAGLHKVFYEAVYNKILVSRPIMPLGKDIGYLPGTKEEKLFHWMQPIYDNLEYLCEASHGEENKKASYEWILDSKKIEMEAVTFIRGRTLPRNYMIIDEAQNLTPHEIKTIISRAGIKTKVVLTGDPTQIDNPYLDQDSNGLTYVVNSFRREKIQGYMFLEKTERSELAKLAAEIL